MLPKPSYIELISYTEGPNGERLNIRIPGMHIDPVTDEWVFDD